MTTVRNLAGILCCAGAMLAFTAQDAVIKSLSGDYALLQLLIMRGIVVLVILIPTALILLGSRGLIMGRPGPMLTRGVLSFFAFTTYYIALTVVPLADAAALFMSAPLFVTALSVILLGEKVGVHRWTAVVVGFAMVLVILNPGSSLFQGMSALPLFSALCYAVIPILTRMIGTTEHLVTMTIYLKISYLVLCGLTLLIIHLGDLQHLDNAFFRPLTRSWQSLPLTDLGLIAVTGMVFTLALVLITQAYRIAAVSAVSPFEYSLILWAAMIGFLVFKDIPSTRLTLGALVMVACGVYITRREARALAGRQT